MFSDPMHSAGIRTNYLRIVTPAGDFDAILSSVVKLTDGSPVLEHGELVTHMDTAPFIDPASNSMMIPVRWVAVGLGIPDEQVEWDNEARTVTIFNSGRIIQFTIGSDQLVVNGVATTMVSPDGLPVRAVVRDERSFIPFRALGNALGVEVGWVPETRTAIFNPQNMR